MTTRPGNELVLHGPAYRTAVALDPEGAVHFAAPVTRRKSVLPGFGITLAFTVMALAVVVLMPLSAAFLKAAAIDPRLFADIVTTPRVLASFRLTFGASALAASINAVFGLLVAWVLVRHEFAGKRFVDAMIDLPFALPTAVAGIALTGLFAANGWFGAVLEPMGLKVAFTRVGVLVALVFIGLPFVVRTVQPVLETLPRDIEEAATTLGATPAQVFARVVFPALLPAVITGFTLAFARGIGEYGSVIFIAGNVPMATEITPLLIIAKLEQFDYQGATAIAVVMLIASFALLLAINASQAWMRSRKQNP